jgi:hypothetical protein
VDGWIFATRRSQLDASALRERITHRLIEHVEESEYPSVTMLDRVEAALATPDDVADYAETLVKKVEATEHPSTEMLNRLDRLVAQLEVMERQERRRRERQESADDDS